jgi:iron-sulfur cluster assembly accessory protein
MSDIPETQTTIKPIHLTQTAISQVRKLQEERDLQENFLRIFVSGGCCSGIQYGMGLDYQIQEGDTQLQFEELHVVVDAVSLTYLEGAIVDYDEDRVGGGFRIENPNENRSCGCGNSLGSEADSESDPDSTAGSCCS